jgi:hypothetical protein
MGMLLRNDVVVRNDADPAIASRERVLQFFGFLAPAVDVVAGYRVVTGCHDSTEQRVRSDEGHPSPVCSNLKN